MLARLHRTALLLALLITTVWAAVFWRSNPQLAWTGLLACLFGWTLTIVIELLTLATVRSTDPTPHASVLDMCRAWWHECIAAVRVFGWWQPFNSQRWPNLIARDENPARAGVVLVHGFVCNRGVWTPWMKKLHQQKTPFIAVNLEPVFADIDGYTPAIEEAVQQLSAQTGRPVLIVAHSMGGLAVRAWLRANPRSQDKVLRCVTIGTPHSGTWLAHLGRTPNAQQMRRDSTWLQKLAESQPPHMPQQFVCWYSNCDNVVMPPATATLHGAENRFVPGMGHVTMVLAPLIMHSTLALLEDEPTAPITAPGESDQVQCSQTAL